MISLSTGLISDRCAYIHRSVKGVAFRGFIASEAITLGKILVIEEEIVANSNAACAKKLIEDSKSLSARLPRMWNHDDYRKVQQLLKRNSCLNKLSKDLVYLSSTVPEIECARAVAKKIRKRRASSLPKENSINKQKHSNTELQRRANSARQRPKAVSWEAEGGSTRSAAPPPSASRGRGSEDDFISLYPVTVNFAHSCCPNAAFCKPTGSPYAFVVAIEDIDPGADIVLSYGSVYAPRDVRKEKIKDLQPACHCARCVIPQNFPNDARLSAMATAVSGSQEAIFSYNAIQDLVSSTSSNESLRRYLHSYSTLLDPLHWCLYAARHQLLRNFSVDPGTATPQELSELAVNLVRAEELIFAKYDFHKLKSCTQFVEFCGNIKKPTVRDALYETFRDCGGLESYILIKKMYTSSMKVGIGIVTDLRNCGGDEDTHARAAELALEYYSPYVACRGSISLSSSMALESSRLGTRSSMKRKQLREGYLCKLGSGRGFFGRKNWKLRWFVLWTTGLAYFETKEKSSQKGYIPVESFISLHCHVDQSQHTMAVGDCRYFSISYRDPVTERVLTILVRTQSQDDHEEWTRALSNLVSDNDYSGKTASDLAVVKKPQTTPKVDSKLETLINANVASFSSVRSCKEK